MIKLLRSNFSRLKKNRLFWFALLLMVAVPLYAVGVRYYDYVIAQETIWETADGLWFVGGMYISVVASVFISLFVGTEFSDGTIRNKLTVGHTRSEIYFSNLITCSAVSLFYHLVFIAVLFGAGSLLLKTWNTPAKTLVILTALSLVTVIAMSAIFTMLAMLIHSRSAGAVTAMLVAMGMLIVTMTINATLSAPEFIDNAFHMTDVGEVVKSDPIPNPRYVAGFEREMYQHILNLIPTGQMAQFGNMDYTSDMAYLPLYAVVVAVICTVVGLAAFRRKDIR
ncbi:MAG: ABC transporter permease subunit [Oscillospiraceae bacterium]|nr:ABC transporter permease subunit [Oscillospiraceae bacterium]